MINPMNYLLPYDFHPLPVWPTTRINPAQLTRSSLLGPIPNIATGRVQPAVVNHIKPKVTV